jgi:hypothetical protein
MPVISAVLVIVRTRLVSVSTDRIDHARRLAPQDPQPGRRDNLFSEFCAEAARDCARG